MKWLWSMLAVVLPAAEVQSITWDFNSPGDDQGWYAQSDSWVTYSAYVTRYPSEVKDGIWRITLAGSSLELVSPAIDQDSGLFDRLAVRYRLVHPRPIGPSSFLLTWTNEHNRSSPGADLSPAPGGSGSSYSRFLLLVAPHTYGTEWQEMVVEDLRTKLVQWPTGDQTGILWEGLLIDLRVHLKLGDLGTWPEAVEVDRIVLTGVEEQLLGELPPPQVVEAASSGELFAKPVFYPLGKSGVRADWWFINPTAALGDLDGDGDLDLVATYRPGETDQGWLSAYNDGKGGFAQSQNHATEVAPYLQGRDVDGDGWMDLLLNRGTFMHLVLMLNQAGTGWLTIQEFDGFYPMGLTDADGDGDTDLWGIEDPVQQNALWLFTNDGKGHLGQPREIGRELHEEGYGASLMVQHLREGKATGIMWTHLGGRQGYRVTYLDGRGEVVEEPLAVDLSFDSSPLVRYVGDFDLDGDVDLVTSHEQLIKDRAVFKGVDFRVNNGDGSLDTRGWDDEVELCSNVEFMDLNADGILDPVFVDSDERDPAVTVSLGVKGGLPVPEGRYPLRGRGGAVLGGDLDGDGDVDLVVLEQNVGGKGGVHALLNQLSERRTAVSEETGKGQPSSFRLGPNYPNPFNPQTLIPLTMPTAVPLAHLRVYNLLGQPVRTLVHGPLSAGTHTVTWDGRDDLGRSVSSGMYLYRFEAGEWRASGKMVKSE